MPAQRLCSKHVCHPPAMTPRTRILPRFSYLSLSTHQPLFMANRSDSLMEFPGCTPCGFAGVAAGMGANGPWEVAVTGGLAQTLLELELELELGAFPPLKNDPVSDDRDGIGFGFNGCFSLSFIFSRSLSIFFSSPEAVGFSSCKRKLRADGSLEEAIGADVVVVEGIGG